MDQIISQLITSYHVKKTSDNTFEIITTDYNTLKQIELDNCRLALYAFTSNECYVIGCYNYH